MKVLTAILVLVLLASCQSGPTQPNVDDPIYLTRQQFWNLWGAVDSVRPGLIVSDTVTVVELYGPELDAMPIIIVDRAPKKKTKGGGSMPIIIVNPRTVAQREWVLNKLDEMK